MSPPGGRTLCLSSEPLPSNPSWKLMVAATGKVVAIRRSGLKSFKVGSYAQAFSKPTSKAALALSRLCLAISPCLLHHSRPLAHDPRASVHAREPQRLMQFGSVGNHERHTLRLGSLIPPCCIGQSGVHVVALHESSSLILR
jgi:hypothetical protein